MVEDKEENWPVALGMTGPRRLLLWLECFSPQSLSDLEPEWFRLILVSSNATSTGWSSHSPSSIAVSHYPRCPFYDSPWSREVSLSGSPSHRAADSELRRKNTCFISLPFFLGGGQLSRATPTPEHRSRTQLHPPEGPGLPSSQLCTLCSEQVSVDLKSSPWGVLCLQHSEWKTLL